MNNLIEERIAEYLSKGTPHNIKGLTAEHIARGKTPRGIAELWLHDRLCHPLIESNETDEPNANNSYSLLPFSRVVWESIQEGGAKAWQFDVQLRIDYTNLNTNLLRQAIERVIEAHPVFHMRIDEEGLQHYDSTYRTPYFNYEIRKDEQGNVLLHLTFNRILGDATSLMHFLADIDRAYHDEPIPHDAYLNYLREQECCTHSHAYQQSKAHQEATFDAVKHTRPISASKDCALGTMGIHTLNVNNGKPIDNTLITAAVALAIMDYNHTDEAALTWAYVGRENAEEQHIFGSLHRDVPFVLRLTEDETPASILRQARQQKEQGILHSRYPYTFLASNRVLWANAVNVLCQPSPSDALSSCRMRFEVITPDDTPHPAYAMLDIEQTEGSDLLIFKYSQAYYSASDIQSFAELIRKNAQMLM